MRACNKTGISRYLSPIHMHRLRERASDNESNERMSYGLAIFKIHRLIYNHHLEK